MKELVDRLLDCGNDFQKKEAAAALEKYEWVIVDVLRDKEITVLLLNNPDVLRYDEDAQHHVFTEMCRDYKLLVFTYDKEEVRSGRIETKFLKRPKYTLPTFSDLDDMQVINTTSDLTVLECSLREYCNIDNMGDQYFCEQDPEVFRMDSILEYSTDYGKYASYLERMIFKGKQIAYVRRAGRYSGDVSLYITNEEAFREFIKWVEQFGTTEIEVYGPDAEVDFLGSTLEDLYCSGDQQLHK